MSIEALRKKKRMPAEVNGRAEIGRVAGSHVR